jgi:hypothetical protein
MIVIKEQVCYDILDEKKRSGDDRFWIKEAVLG